MTNILEICKTHNIELPDAEAFEKAVLENYITRAEHEKKLAKVETDRDKWKLQAETAEETLKGFEGIDPKDLQKQIDDWKNKAENAEKDYQAKLDARDFEDALKAELDGVKFSSESAKKAITAEIRSAGLKIKDGKILGFNDLMDSLRKSDAAAFAGDVPPASFTGVRSNNTNLPTTDRHSIMKIKDAGERQRAIAQNLGLFRKEN